MTFVGYSLEIHGIKFIVTLFDLPQNTNNDKTRQLHKSKWKSGKEAQKETTRLIDIGLPQSKNKVNSNSTVRPGSKVKYNEGKYKLTNYIDWVDKI